MISCTDGSTPFDVRAQATFVRGLILLLILVGLATDGPLCAGEAPPSVPDEETQQLMSGFYKRYLDGGLLSEINEANIPNMQYVMPAMIEPLTDDADVKRGLLDLVVAVIG